MLGSFPFPTIESLSSALCLTLVLLFSLYGLLLWASSTKVHQRNFDEQKAISATVVTQRVVNVQLGGGLYQMPVSRTLVLLEVAFELKVDGRNESCIVNSAPFEVTDRAAFLRRNRIDEGRKEVFVVRRPGKTICSLTRFPEIQARDWFVISAFALLWGCFAARHVVAVLSFIKQKKCELA